MSDPLSIVKVSIVTVCMNRRAHLLVSADHVSRWPHHQEHLILDWSSDQPLTRADLPADSRIRLVRVDGERYWFFKGRLCEFLEQQIALTGVYCVGADRHASYSVE